MQEEIFGPVLVAMTFRTPAEAAELANNTVYGLAASIWSENINVALDLASQVKAGVVWVNCTNQFDAACGFGGYRESGYGREGGREGMLEYLTPKWLHTLPAAPAKAADRGGSAMKTGIRSRTTATFARRSTIDRTVKQYIGGKQARPDSGYSFPVYGRDGELLGEAPLGNRKDIRNAVEAARNASGWARTTAHNRAQVIYYIAENMIQRRDEIAHRLAARRWRRAGRLSKSISPSSASSPMPRGPTSTTAWCTIRRAATLPSRCRSRWAPSAFSRPAKRRCSDCSRLCCPRSRWATPSLPCHRNATRSIIGDLYQVLDTSDLPGGVVNLVAGQPAELAKTLAEHDGIEAIWCFRSNEEADMVRAASIGNMKQVWTNDGHAVRLVQSRAGRRPLVPAARHAGEKHLGAVRGIVRAIAEGCPRPRSTACAISSLHHRASYPGP